MRDDISSSVSVIAVTFEDDSNAHEALTTLNELESQRQIGIRGAAVVARDETGQVLDKDQVGNESHVGTAAEHAQREAKRKARKELLHTRATRSTWSTSAKSSPS